MSPQRRADHLEEITEHAADPSGREDPTPLIEQAIAQTLRQEGLEQHVDPAILQGLKQFSAQHRGAAVEEIATELVRIVLEARIPKLAKQPKLLRRVVQQVSETILADDAARERFSRFWQRLGEAGP